MKLFFLFFLLTGFLIEAYASSYCRQQDDGCQPYTVTGRACLEGEHCEELTSGSYKGYHLKSNIPFNDNRQGRIRPNMFTQAVLKDEIGKCIAKADINPPTPAECNLSNIETRQPFRLIDTRCDSKSVYCSYHTSGPYEGLLEKSNIMPSDARFAGLNPEVTSATQEKCIRDGKSICNVHGGARFDQIALNCNSSARYCRKITSGRYAGLIKRSSHKAPEENNPTWIAIPKVLKCRPQLAYMAKKLALGGPPSSVANIENNKVLSSLLNAGDPDLMGQSGAGGGGNDPVLPSAETWPDLNLEQVDSGVLQRLKNFFVGLVRMLLGGGNTNSQQTPDGASTTGASTAGASTAGASTAGTSTTGASTAGASTAGASTTGASTAGTVTPSTANTPTTANAPATTVAETPEQARARLNNLLKVSSWGALTLHDNDGEVAFLPKNLFQGMTHLKEISLTLPAVTTLPAGLFSGLTNLKTITLSSKNLTTLPAGFLSGLTNLRGFSFLQDFYGNSKLTTLPENLFSEATKLQAITLNGKLTTLPEGLFSGLPRLMHVNLSSNNLTTLPASLLSHLNNGLLTLSLGGNQFTSIPEALMSSPTLKELILGGNKLSSLSGVFRSPKLGVLGLSGNKLSSLPKDIFKGAPGLFLLYLEGNKLSSLPKDIFKGTRMLYLHLGGNKLSSLPVGLFSFLKNNCQLLKIDLGYNKLSSLPLGLFSGCKQLQMVLLRGNNISTIPDDLLRNMNRHFRYGGLNGMFNTRSNNRPRLDLSKTKLSQKEADRIKRDYPKVDLIWSN